MEETGKGEEKSSSNRLQLPHGAAAVRVACRWMPVSRVHYTGYDRAIPAQCVSLLLHMKRQRRGGGGQKREM